MHSDIIVLAAGKGSRMQSGQAKVLHKLAGRTLIQHVYAQAMALNPRSTTVVVGHQSEQVIKHLGEQVRYVHQETQLGTGHAVQLAVADIADDGVVLVLYGDVPLVALETLEQAVNAALAEKVGLITSVFDDPAELGRIVRDPSGAITRIVEYKDADPAQIALREINSGIMAVPTRALKTWLTQIRPNNAQGEYYLTDIIALAVADGVKIEGILAPFPEDVTGVNDRVQLAELERVFQTRQAHALMRGGVTLADPQRVDVRGTVNAGKDCFIDVNVILHGDVTLGEGVSVGAGTVIIDSIIGDHTEILPHTVIEQAVVADHCSLGPFARIRPGTQLDPGVKVGNFVEIKKSHLGQGTKAGHLAYLGDAIIGADSNVGAGTVTCNYDGVDKHQTHIGDGAFIGTNSTLVAPLEIGDGAFIAAGSTVTVPVAPTELAVGRAKQRNIKGWVRPDQRKGQ